MSTNRDDADRIAAEGVSVIRRKSQASRLALTAAAIRHGAALGTSEAGSTREQADAVAHRVYVPLKPAQPRKPYFVGVGDDLSVGVYEIDAQEVTDVQDAEAAADVADVAAEVAADVVAVEVIL
jgi:hypothetical protein